MTYLMTYLKEQSRHATMQDAIVALPRRQDNRLLVVEELENGNAFIVTGPDCRRVGNIIRVGELT